MDGATTPAPSASDQQARVNRLEAELTALQAELETLAARTGTDDEWVARGRDLLTKADTALQEGNLDKAWAYLHTAERLRIHAINAVDGQEALRTEARELLLEAKHSPLAWRAEAVRERLTTADGSLRDVTDIDVSSAHQLLHEGYQRLQLKRHHLQTQVKYLKWWALAATLLFVLVGASSAGIPALPSPLVDLSADNSTAATPASPGSPALFTVYILLSGVLGASLFGLRSLRTQPSAANTPAYLTSGRTAAARVVVGAGSALAVFFFLRSGLLAIDMGSGIDQGAFLIALGFVAGYSQRIVHATVESIASTTESGATDAGSSEGG
jgi:hypothetical protein